MQLRFLPILISIVVTSTVLFGGWFLYDSLAMENPLNKIAQGIPGVEKAAVSVDNGKAVFRLHLSRDANLREIYGKIMAESSPIAGKREVVLEVTSNTSPALEEWWSKALFEVAQAMENRQYAQIPATLEKLAGDKNGVKADCEMDDKNVYVRLVSGEHSKFIILPRTPARLGVWPNE